MNKKSNVLACWVHCTIYTITVVVFLFFGGLDLSLFSVILIYISHHIFDGSYLLDYWFKLIDTRSWDTHIPRHSDGSLDLTGNNNNLGRLVSISFGAIVYVVADNILHLFLMFLIVKYTVL
jgi:hypothetical protein